MKTNIIKGIWGEEQGNNQALVFETRGKEKSSIVYDGSGITLEGITFSGGTITGADYDLTDDLGANPTPVATRTNNPIVGTNKPNVNIDVLDAAIGADVTPAARTTGPVAAANTVNANIDALDTAIGADVSPLTRTVGVIAVGGTVNANIDALDTAIGSDAQFAGQAKNIATANSVIQNLQSLDTYKSVRTIKKTIGAPSFGGTDYNFASAANANEQVITLTNVVPAKCRVLDVVVYCDAVFSNAVSMAADVGTTSGGGELITSGQVYAAGNLIYAANGGAPIMAISGSAANIYVNATPGANWDQFVAGSMSVFVTVIDLNNI